ncbi:hypothetical protein [Rhodococcus marinonascens]|uniref:hypothetical protein n=1 Tax=Rhodococcus marinonascens TaxID=38311 RepID=UPI0009346E0B|nr:hypothetical protein [Rhodococcus marinonascens]
MFGQKQDNELYLPVPPAAAFAALKSAVEQRFTLKSAEDFTMSCTFTSGMSAFTWGEKFSAQVVPVEGGATIKVSGVGKIGAQIQQNARTSKLTNQLFSDVTAALRPS